MPEISKSTKPIADEKSDILKKNVLGKSKKWDNEDYLYFVVSLLYISGITTYCCQLIDGFRKVKNALDDDYVGIPLFVFKFYNFLLAFTVLIVTCRITQRFLKLWPILGIVNIFIGFAGLLYFYNHFTTDPNAGEHFQIFKCTLLSMPFWFSTNMKREYYGDKMFLVIYDGEESSTKKMGIN